MPLPRLLGAFEALPAFDRLLRVIPGTGESMRVGGLAGSSDAVLIAAMARAMPQRQIVIVTDQLTDAERWLADLQALVDDIPVALYPPREGFGEVEPHAEVAGERVETLEKLVGGNVRLLLTTSRALLERTTLPGALAAARLELRKGDERRPEDIIAHLDQVGLERVVEGLAGAGLARDVPDPSIERYGSSARTHVVKSGETLSHLAQRYSTSVARIKSTNGLKSDRIRIGQTLRIPAR